MDNESFMQLENNSGKAISSSHDNYDDRVAEKMMHLRKTRSANERSQQTEEYNNTINNNNKKNNDDDNVVDILGERLHMQSQLSKTFQSFKMTQAIDTRITGITYNISKETERRKIISRKGEEVNKPLSYTGSIKSSLPAAHLRTGFVSKQNSNNSNNDIRLSTESMNGGCINFVKRMNADRANGSANLFAASWIDKATTTERMNCVHLESDHNELNAVPKFADGQPIIQFASYSSYRSSIARRSRLSFVTLPSYSLLWKKTFRGVRTKVKRVTQSSSENIVPLDALIPNKCLAELERLYAEFRASESALAAARTDAGECYKSVHRSKYCPSQSDASDGDSDSNNGHDCELLNVNTIATADFIDSPNNMRLSIPAATNASFCSFASVQGVQVQQANIFEVLPANSRRSVFLNRSDCVTTGCLTSNDRPRSSSFSSDDRYSNLLHERNHNKGNCFDSAENQEIKNDVVVVGAINNGNRSDNSARVPEMSTSAIRAQPSLSIQVNAESSDQNNNSNYTANKNYSYFHSSTNNCNNNNNIICVETASVNVEVGVPQRSADNGISVVNCNYSSVSPVNNESVCKKSATTPNTVDSVRVNRSVSEVSNIIRKVENKVNNNNIVSKSSTQRDSSGNKIKPVEASDCINIISISAPSQSEQMNAQHSNTNIPTPLTVLGSPTLLSSQVSGVSRQDVKTCKSVVAPEQLRTFTSTESQTDEILSTQLRLDRVPVSPILSRVQRRHDRRERRHLHQQLSTSYPHPHPHQFYISAPLRRPLDRHSMSPGSGPVPDITTLHLQSGVHNTLGSSSATLPAAMSALLRPMLPDLLHRDFPPPYSAIPLNRCATTTLTSPSPPTIVGPAPPPPGATFLSPVISTVPMPGVSRPVVNDGRFTLPLPTIRRLVSYICYKHF